MPLIHVLGYAAREVGEVYERARDLCSGNGEISRLLPSLWGLWLYYVVRGEHRTAAGISTELLSTAHSQDLRFPLAHYSAGCSAFWMADIEAASTILGDAVGAYDPADRCATHRPL